MILHMTIKRQYFDEIKAGVKKKEYREVKPFWDKKLKGKKYTHILFQNGYRSDSPRIMVEYKGYNVEEITHPFFNNITLNVYAIDLGGVNVI